MVADVRESSAQSSMAQLGQWPNRVALVAFGKNRPCGEHAVLTAGDGGRLEVAEPSQLRDWANRQTPPRAWVCWDLSSWLPFDPASEPSGAGYTGLTGDICWKTVYNSELFTLLMQELESRPYSLVMSQAQLFGEHSAGAEPHV